MIWIEDYGILSTCELCTLNESKKVHSFLTNSKKVEILVIGQSPGRNEISTGRPFVGESGNLINPILMQYSQDIAYINTISCRPLNTEKSIDRTPTSVEVKSCRGRFNSDFYFVVDNYKPKVIFVFGAVAKKAVNLILKSEEYANLNVRFLDHPAHIIRNRHMEGKFTSDIHNILKSVFNMSNMDEIIKSFVTYDDSMRQQFLDDAKNSRNLGTDIETNQLNMFDLIFTIGTIAISCDKRTYFFDCRNKDIKTIDVLIEVLDDLRIQKVFADIMFDVVSLQSESYNIPVNNYADLFPLAFIYNNTFMEYGLEAITMRYFPELASYKSKFHRNLDEDKSFLDVETNELMIYNCFDAFVTRITFNHLYDKLNEKVRLAFDRIGTRVLPALVSMKISGMKVDINLLDSYVKIFKERFKELSDLFEKKYNVKNINSPVQVSKWLFEDLKLKPIKYNKPTQKQKEAGIKRGNPSTDKIVVEAYAAEFPDVRLLYEARRVANLINYTLKSIRDNVDYNDVIHPRYKHYGIQSFRLSCLAPNLQGISRDKTGIDFLDKYPIRAIFIARRPNSYIVEFDYSQQEVRIIAELSRDRSMLEAFERGDDIHRFVASLIFHKPQNEITEFERQIAKSCVFGAIFGVSAKEMAIKLRIKEKEAQSYLDIFFRLFPGIKSYIERQHNILINKGAIVSVLGQPRKFNIHKNNINDCKREAANHTIQAPGAGITFLSLRLIYDKLEEDRLLNKEIFIIHTVHDSVIFDVPFAHLDYISEVVPKIMSSVPKKLNFNVVFPVDMKIGKRWGESLSIEEIKKEVTK